MSLLAREAREAADGARRQIAAVSGLRARLAKLDRPLVVTCARGSSDHAATYGKYVIETTCDRVVASVGPSVASLYGRAASALAGGAFVAVSQSGRSPDLLELTERAKRAGAFVIGMINDERAPLVDLCDLVIPLCAGEEHAVAATKSYLLACFAFVQLAAAWNPALDAIVAAVPDAFAAASEASLPLAGATSCYVVGRGVGLGPAAELALKLKETCGLHAEAFSTAEVLHGPVALVEPGYPIVAIEQADETHAATREVLDRLAALGATIHRLPASNAPPLVAPLCQVLGAYLALPALAIARGRDADQPRHLRKVTETR